MTYRIRSPGPVPKRYWPYGLILLIVLVPTAVQNDRDGLFGVRGLLALLTLVALIVAVVRSSMLVRIDETGLRLGQDRLAWTDVDEIALSPGRLDAYLTSSAGLPAGMRSRILDPSVPAPADRTSLSVSFDPAHDPGVARACREHAPAGVKIS